MGTFSLAAISGFLDADSASSALAATINPRVLGDDSTNNASGPLAVFYANCQGSGLAYWLRRSPAFRRAYPRVRCVAVHDLVDRREEDFSEEQAAWLGSCALFVFPWRTSPCSISSMMWSFWRAARSRSTNDDGKRCASQR